MIESERARLPERVFRQEYEAAFIEGSGAVFRNIRESATGSFREPVRGMTYYAGLDLAKVEDYTVLVVMDHDARVVFVDRFNRLDWNIQIARIRATLERYNRALVHVDSTGVGEPIYEALCREGISAKPYAFSAKSKADLVNCLALAFERLEIELPIPGAWPEGIEELESFEYSVTNLGHVRSGAPSGQHDDCVMALALAVWPILGFGGPSIPYADVIMPEGSGWWA